MRTIYKYTLDGSGVVGMPKEAKVLCVQNQKGAMVIWAEVNPEDIDINRNYSIYGTGHEMPDGCSGEYVGTCQLDNVSLVMHVYLDS